ncbi:hypothetical protein KL930_003536 [Ogataea haglerorum]|uniref:Zinc finger C2H2 LYAR-type domain-containing protein n=1 Tax=Ogataea haglerorum TaxID=1937702 RepID=A0ABQ7RFA4_9ASCO|nr:uncharacterized protein KL911_003128 [Ogataea haglerorum]KAG7695538.1 hypothetical protein KL915_002928 [Ogataea haglerorum]KAG7695868.1 hypothetical protein KL951_003393 [Ogataea haglerorum]KAG7705708.1 hypothetical protein KL914_003546 [Ogataea haglerorum]KAG7707274.1 hypothetical protein KL950_002934 [Ogataea haglerorum]KAG7718429.1 hypothetical protein KL913_002424 [Ogataea haglerorum]
MVSFSCEVCNDTVVKKKLALHQRQCHGAYFTCIDCNATFYNNDHNSHTSCITEAEKYEKGWKAPKLKSVKSERELQRPHSSEPEKTNNKQKSRAKSAEPSLASFVSGSESLYKVLKKARKGLKKDKSELLKSLKVSKNADGTITVSL